MLVRVGCCILFLVAVVVTATADEPVWQRHVVDDTSRGADGVRLADVNGDGRPDIATDWEEGGETRIYLHPGRDKVTQPWPRTTVGKVKSPEDAMWVDLDGDGKLEMVSSCEGGQRCIFIHTPTDRAQLLTAAWNTISIDVTHRHSMWMFATAIDVDGRDGDDLVVGGKGAGAIVGWLQAPKPPLQAKGWQLHPLYEAGWIMSLQSHDVDADGDQDILISDRRGKQAGIHWLINPGATAVREGKPWTKQTIVSEPREFMFLAMHDLDGDGDQDITCAVKKHGIYLLKNPGNLSRPWAREQVAWPAGCGREKGVAVGDINGDGRVDLVVSCEGAAPPKSGLKWLESTTDSGKATWRSHELSGGEGVKFDRIELVDLDEDGDLDVLTCCERPNLGVIWYENPRDRR